MSTLNFYQSCILADNPLIYLPLNDPTGSTTAKDWSGYGRNATISGGVTLQQPGGMPQGEAGMRFDGSTGSLSVPDTGFLPTGTAPRSLECRLMTTTTSRQGVFGYGLGTNGQLFEVMIGVYTPGMLVTALYGGSSYDVATSTNVADGTCHHCIATFDGAIVNVYVDGLLVATASRASGINTGASDLVVAKQVWEGGDLFNGTQSDLAAYGYALSPQQVQAHWRAAVTLGASHPGLVIKL